MGSLLINVFGFESNKGECWIALDSSETIEDCGYSKNASSWFAHQAGRKQNFFLIKRN